MEAVGEQCNIIHLRLGDPHPSGVLAGVELRVDAQPARRPGIADSVDDRLERPQRGPTPVLRDVAEQPMLDLVPLARPRWKVADVDAEPRLVGDWGSREAT